MEAKYDSWGFVAVGGAVLLWSYNYLPAKVAVSEIDPSALLLARLLLVAPLYLLTLRLRGGGLAELLPHWRRGLLLAALAIGGDMALYLYGLKFTTPSHAALMYVLVPLMVLVLARLMLAEPMGLRKVAGITLAMAGALLLATEDGISFESRYLLGDLLVLGAAACWSLYVVLSKPLAERIGSLRTLTLVILLGIPLVAPAAIAPALRQPWGEVSAAALLSVVYVAVGGTFAAYICYQTALRKLPASVVAPFAYTVPVITALLSVLLMGEVLTVMFFVSAALIFAGLALVRLEGKRPPLRETPGG